MLSISSYLCKKTAIIITPLISLMNDQKDKLDKLNIPSVCLNGSVYYKDKLVEQIKQNKFRLVYTTPEYLTNNKEMLKDIKSLQLIAIDEAHCISSWGNDFRPSYRDLNFIKKEYPYVPIIALTATATKKVKDDIKITPIEIVDEVLKIALTKELKKVEWTEIDNVSGSKTEDKSQAIIQ